MKKLVLLFVLFSISVCGQVSTSPGAPTPSDAITLTLDTTGTGLEDYTGTIYAHTGVTTDGNVWQNVIGSWGDNSTQPALSALGNHIYELVISPNVYDYYGVAESVTITQLSFVFRSADGSQQTSPDIFVDLFQEELSINITSPEQNAVFYNGETTTISAASPINAQLELFVNGNSIATENQNQNISASYTFSSLGAHNIQATATQNGVSETQEIQVYVKTPTDTQSLPAGMQKGINRNDDGSVTFVLEAPYKSDVFLIGEFNDWALNEDYQMYKDGDLFWINVEGLDSDTEYAYQYFIDYEKIVCDPYATKVLDSANDGYISESNYPNLKEYPEGATGIVSTFKINETAYDWQTTSFARPDKNDLIVYELLVRDFSESDSFQEVINKMDYLKNLGITAIELMPVNEFEGNDSWGYNVSQFFALDKAYGTQNKFKELVDIAHQNEIAVIVDVVFNHSYSQCPLLQMYDFDISAGTTSNNPYYNDSHNFAEGGLQFGFDFNHESTYTQNYFKDVMSYWIDEYKIDGFRLDFTKGFTNVIYPAGDYGSAYNQARIDRLTDYANYVWNNHGSDVYMILEHLAENSEEQVLSQNGLMLWGNMNYNYNQNTMGYAEGADISWAYYGTRNFSQPNLVSYMESHDEERLMFKNISYGNASGSYDVQTLETALEREELAGVFFLSLPGPKMIWQFGELGYDISIETNGRTGRKPIHWEYYDDENRRNIYDVWAQMIALKKANDVLDTQDVSLSVSGLSKRINLNHSSNDVVILGNFDVTTQSISPNFTTTGTWYEFFSGSELDVSDTSSEISLEAGEYRLYSRNPLNNPLAVDEIDTPGLKPILYPNPTSGTFQINSPANDLTIYNLMGQKVATFVGEYRTGKEFDIKQLSQGVYFVTFSNGGKYHSLKLICK